MRIDLYTKCWNDAHMLGFFFRHYDRFVDRYVVYDDGSEDGSIEILQSHPRVEIRSLHYDDPNSRILSSASLANECWKESRGSADWVILTDIDEHLSHPDLVAYLAACKASGVTLIPAIGYQMFSEVFPEPDVLLEEHLVLGCRYPMMDKVNILSPADIESIQWGPGRHSGNLSGRIDFPPRDEVLLLHYKYLDFERLYARHTKCAARSRAVDVQRGYGFEYFWSRDQLWDDWNSVKSNLVDVRKIDVSAGVDLVIQRL